MMHFIGRGMPRPDARGVRGASSEAILLILGVAAALLIAVTVFGRDLVRLQKAGSSALDRGAAESEGRGGASDSALLLPGNSASTPGIAGKGGSGGPGGGGAKGGQGGGVSLPPGATAQGSSPLESDDAWEPPRGSGGTGGPGGSGGPGGGKSDPIESRIARAHDLAVRGAFLAERLRSVLNESVEGRDHRRDLERILAELNASEQALRKEPDPRAAEAAGAVGKLRGQVERDRDRGSNEKIDQKGLVGEFSAVFAEAERNGIDTRRLKEMVDRGDVALKIVPVSPDAGAEYNSLTNNIESPADNLENGRIKPGYYGLALHELFHAYVDQVSDPEFEAAFAEQKKVGKKDGDTISAEGVADEFGGNWLKEVLVPKIALLLEQSTSAEDAALRMEAFLAGREGRTFSFPGSYTNKPGDRVLEEAYARQIARILGAGPDDLRRRWTDRFAGLTPEERGKRASFAAESEYRSRVNAAVQAAQGAKTPEERRRILEEAIARGRTTSSGERIPYARVETSFVMPAVKDADPEVRRIALELARQLRD